MGTTKRNPLPFSVRLDIKTSWSLQAKFVCQTDAEAFARHLALQLKSPGRLSVGLFHKNSLKARYDGRGIKYFINKGIASAFHPAQEPDGISTRTPIPAEVDQGPKPI